MDKTLGNVTEDKALNKAVAMASFKIIYQKNRISKKHVKIHLDELGQYQQLFEETQITVRKFINSPEKVQRRYLRKIKNPHEI